MRCPKCGYNSFDHLDSCKKCGKDLVEFKERYGIRSVLFPGEMMPAGAAAVDQAEAGSSAAEAAVAAAATAATAATAAAATDTLAEADDFTEATETSGEDADDFGFDFMGESAEEEDLSFDELFEDAPADEDVEETLPSPEEEAAAAAEAGDDLDAPDDFSFDVSEEKSEGESGEVLADEPELEDDFGFDVSKETEETAVAEENAVEDSGPPEDLSADDFELPPAEEEEFSFSNDEVEFEEAGEEEAGPGTKEDPKDPFELPGSPQHEESPEQSSEASSAGPVPWDDATEETDPLLEEQSEPPEPFVPPEQFDEPELPQSYQQGSTSSSQVDRLSPQSGAILDEVAEPEPPPEIEDAPDSGAVAVADVPPAPAVELGSGDAGPEAGVAGPTEGFTEAGGSEAAGPGDEAEETMAAGTVLTAGTIAAAVVVAADDAGTGAVEVRIGSAAPAEESELHPSLAGRIGAFCCDLLLLATIGFCFVVAAEMAMAESGDGLFPSLETLIDLSVPYFLVLFFLAFGYFTLFHFLAGQTPGKMLARLRVETVAGEPLVFSQAFLRSVGGLLQLLPAGLGYLVILFSKDRRGWNDQLAGTRLIALRRQIEEG